MRTIELGHSGLRLEINLKADGIHASYSLHAGSTYLGGGVIREARSVFFEGDTLFFGHAYLRLPKGEAKATAQWLASERPALVHVEGF